MSVAENLKNVQDTITKICGKYRRKASEVTLVAVSKRQSLARIRACLEAGQRVFGENIVQDAKRTWIDGGLREEYPDVRLHLIGALQSNKAKEAVAFFDCIETVDRPKLVDALKKEEQKQGLQREYFVQVNTGEELQKAGVTPDQLEDLLAYARDAGLRVTGLMCIPPMQEPAMLHFAFLRHLARRHGLEKLSMGMSEDFEKALAVSASHIRVGSAIFGPRDNG